jgi:hypothetical protein
MDLSDSHGAEDTRKQQYLAIERRPRPSGRTGRREWAAEQPAFSASRSSLELDDWQMLPAGATLDDEPEHFAWRAADCNVRRCTRCRHRPIRPGLNTRRQVRGWTVVVGFVGRSAVEVLVWAMLVVPSEAEDQLSPHVITSQWDGDAACALLLERADEAFDHSDAAAPAHGATSMIERA